MLVESEMRYRRLFETAKDGILILDFETGKIVDANPFIVKLIDAPLEEIVGEKLWEIGLFMNKEESIQAFAELKLKGYIRFEDMPIQSRKGEVRQVEFISNVYLANNTKVIQCNIRDITERKMSEQALIASFKLIQKMNDKLIIVNARAEESDKLKSAFLANISHEIRTPLNAIMGFSNILLEPSKSEKDLEKNLRIVIESSEQLLTIINDIIDVSKIETGQLLVTEELVNINELMNELYDDYYKKAELKNIHLNLSSRHLKDITKISTDEKRLKQIINNLLHNALKFTKAGEIEFGFREIEHFIEFYVKDTGIGIASEHHDLIFKRFRQVVPLSHEIYSGNGLGLPIAKALLEKMGGDIFVTSELDKGSTFTVILPNK
jgi:PAS domain S-box-containing protein